MHVADGKIKRQEEGTNATEYPRNASGLGVKRTGQSVYFLRSSSNLRNKG